MSVLLDALKKSEEEKKKTEDGIVPDGGASGAPKPPEESQPQEAAKAEASLSPKEKQEDVPPPSPAKPTGGGGIGKLGMFSHSAPIPKKPHVTKRPAGSPPPSLAKSPAAGAPGAPQLSEAPSPGMKPAPAPAAPAPAAPAPKAAFDFDSISVPELAASTPAAAKSAVAGSVVGAGKSAVDVAPGADEASAEGRSGAVVLAIAAGALVAVAGGAYLLFSSPSPDGGGAASQRATASAPTGQQESADAQVDPADLLPLPTPHIDIQSELVNFASYTAEGAAASDESSEIANRIAILTSSFLESASNPEEAQPAVASADLDVDLEAGAFQTEEETQAIEDTIKSYALLDASLSGSDLSRNHADVDLGSGVRLYSVAGETDAAETSFGGAVQSQGESAEAEEASMTVAAADVTVVPSEKSGAIKRFLEEAKREYDAGNLAAAEVVFRKVLSDDPDNINAMKGLAAVASETGRYRLSASIYLKVLDLKPDDAVAISELVSMHQRQSNFRLTEGRLKSLLGKVPEHDSRLYFSLGNLYAEQGRWHEATQNYYNAYSGDSSNPDYAFNLAVSLEYTNRQKTALNYYKAALDLAQNAPHNFEESVLTTRILQLEN